MNILPKKRWHVRTKENIARVRKDEAEAARLEKEIETRAKLAEQEARTSLLREKARQNRIAEVEDEPTQEKEEPQLHANIYNEKGNINFFQDIEDGKQLGGSNKEYEEEKKQEKEKYEKDIGLLTYLGQDSLELKNKEAWYADKSNQIKELKGDEELDLKIKNKLDPLNDLMKYTGLKIYPSTSKKNEIIINKEPLKHDTVYTKHKKGKKTKSKKSKKQKRDQSPYSKKCKKRKRSRSTSSSDSENPRKKKSRKHSKRSKEISSESEDSEYEDEKQNKLKKMREERLKREAIERKRVEKLLSGNKEDKEENKSIFPVPKYNNQFNPQYARQNKETPTLKSGVKYWLH